MGMIMKRYTITIFGLIIVNFLNACSQGEPEFKSLNFFNDTDEDVFIHSLEGISLYAKGKGPQNFGHRVLKPKTLGALNTSGSISFSFPIVIEWEPGDASEDKNSVKGEKTKKVVQMIQKPKGFEGDMLEVSAAVVLVFGKDKQWHFDIIYGDSYIGNTTLLDFYGAEQTNPSGNQ